MSSQFYSEWRAIHSSSANPTTHSVRGCYLTPPVGRVARRRANERHVIMLRRIGDRKADRHEIQQRRIAGGHTLLAEIVAHLKSQFVFAEWQGTAADQIDPAVFPG